MLERGVHSGRFVQAPPSIEAALAALAARQHGVARTLHLLDLGLTSSTISKRVARGSLHRRYRGVYAIGHAALSREGEWLAAVFAAGDGAGLGLLAAASLRGLWRYQVPTIDVLTTRQLLPQGCVRFHQTRRVDPRDISDCHGIPTVTVARLCVDLSDVLTKWELASVIHEAAFRGSFSLLATLDAIERANGRHNLAVLHKALAMHRDGSAGTKSRQELKFLIALERARLPEPDVNVRINGVEVDFHWPDLKLAVELDGHGHARPQTRTQDASRAAVLTAAGYEVLRFADPLVAASALTGRLTGRGG